MSSDGSKEGSSDAEKNVEAVAIFSYDLFRFKDPETDLEFRTILYPSLTESKRLRGEASIAFEHEITSDFDWVLEAYDSYDSDPATVAVEKHDWGVGLALAWEF